MKVNQRPWVSRVLFIDRRYRSALLRHAVLLALAASVLTFGIQWGVNHFLNKSEWVQKMMAPNMVPALSAGIAFFAVFATLIAFGLIISNKLVGPFFRMRRHMDAVTEGRQSTSEFRFRQEDFFLEVGESYNRLLQVIQAHRHRAQAHERAALVESGGSVTGSREEPLARLKAAANSSSSKA